MKKKLITTLRIEFLAESLNVFYKLHYCVKATRKNQCLKLIKDSGMLDNLDISGYTNFELEFDFELISSKRAYDIINYAPTIKMCEDSLVDLKLFKNDDNMNIVRHVINKPKKIKGLENNTTVIKIFGERNE